MRPITPTTNAMRVRRLLLSLLLLAGVFAAFAPAALAGEPSFALRPVTYNPKIPATKSYFVLQLKPGQTMRNRFTVVNAGTATGTAYLYPVDATTGETSGAVYLSRARPRRDVGAWLKLDASQVTLAPGERRVIGFTVNVPRRLRPGDHLGGIVAENARLTEGGGESQLQIKIQHLTIAAVQVKLPGKGAHSFLIGGVKPRGGNGYQRVLVRLRNRGTVMEKPLLTLTLTDADGQQVAKRTLKLDTFLPRTTIDYPVLLPGQALEPGSYRADVSLVFAGKLIQQNIPLTVSPSQYTQVFAGAPAVRAQAHSRDLESMLPWFIAAFAVLVVAGAFVYRRWLYYL